MAEEGRRKKENDWQGTVPHGELPRLLNPPEGYITTANQDLNQYGKANPINLPMGPYRAERIRDLLEMRRELAPEDMFKMLPPCPSSSSLLAAARLE